MIRNGRAGLTGAAALVALAVVAGPGHRTVAGQTIDISTAPRALASNGAVVVMPEVAGLDCADMAHVLRRIDLSNYRGAAPLPSDHPDWPIFEYEDRLTGLYYHDCTLGDNQLEDPGTAFSFGFETQ